MTSRPLQALALATGVFAPGTTAQTITEIIDSSGDGSSVLDGSFAVAVDASGNAFVTGQDSDNAFRITPGGVVTEILDATGDGVHPFTTGLAPAVDGAGNVFVPGLDSDNVFRITPAGAVTEVIDATGDGMGNGLDRPFSVAADAARNIYVTGNGTDNVFKVTPAGVVTEIIDASGDGMGNNLDGPSGIDVDTAGNVYVSGQTSNNVFRITPAGAVTEIIDTSGDGMGGTFGGGEGIDTDSAGNVYVSAWSSHRLFQVTPSGVITVVLSDMLTPFLGGRGVTVDANDDVYVCGFHTDNAYRLTFPAAPVGTNYCISVANSTGGPAVISGSGSASVAANDLILAATPVPDQPGLFFYGPQQTQAPFGNGFLCVAGGIGRLPVENASGNLITHVLDNTNPPNGFTVITSGSTWNFQAWVRDPAAGGAAFNLSDGLEVAFSP